MRRRCSPFFIGLSRGKQALVLLVFSSLLLAVGCGSTAENNPPPPPNPAPQVTSFVATPATIQSGGSSTLTWSTSNATSVSIDNGIGSKPVNSPPEGVVVKPTATTTYTLTATGAGGTATATATVTVNAPPAAKPTVVSFTANPATISPNGTSTLTWSTTNATSVTIDNGLGTQPANSPEGGKAVNPAATTTYTLVATGPGGQSDPATATVTVSTATGLQKLNHIVFMIQENRSFDNYFGKLNDYRVKLGLGADVDGIPADASNAAWTMAQDGSRSISGTIAPFHLRTGCVDNVTPSWNEAHVQRWRNRPACEPGSCDPLKPVPPMDGFTQQATAYAYNRIEWDIKGLRTMGYYTADDFPFYYYMATQFATSNRWFSPLLSRTQPNLLYAYAATSAGYIHAPAVTDPKLPQPTIFDRLEAAGISWKVYNPVPDGVPVLGIFPVYTKFNGSKIVPIDQYFTDLKNGTLPAVAFVLSNGQGLDEHPGPDLPNRPPDPNSPDPNKRCTWQPPNIVDPTLSNDNPKKYDVATWNAGTPPPTGCGTHVQAGAQYAAMIINSLLNSSSWKDSVFVLTFDEFGGFYDHVPPQPATPPDNIPPRYKIDPATGKSSDVRGGFHMTGGRVPFILISPFARAHYVSNTVMDYTAVLKMIEDRFGLQPLTARDAAQPSMTEFFDFDNPPWMTPPADIPAQNITLSCDRSKLP